MTMAHLFHLSSQWVGLFPGDCGRCTIGGWHRSRWWHIELNLTVIPIFACLFQCRISTNGLKTQQILYQQGNYAPSHTSCFESSKRDLHIASIERFIADASSSSERRPARLAALALTVVSSPRTVKSEQPPSERELIDWKILVDSASGLPAVDVSD